MQKGDEKIKRQSNFELLRIIAMVSILFGHYVTKGGIVFSESCLPQKFSLLFWGGGKLGVSVFALMTGYFTVGKRNAEKTVRIWLELLYFSFISLMLFQLFDPENVNNELIKSTFLPISTQTWWYMTNYIFILLLSPLINMVIAQLNEENFKRIILLLLIGFSVIPTFIYKANPYFSNLSWLIVLYMVGSYIRKNIGKIAVWKSMIVFLISELLMWALILIFEPNTAVETNYFSYMYRLPMFTASVAMICVFKDMKISSRAINVAAKYAGGVYLFHDGLFMRSNWWTLIGAGNYHKSWRFILNMIVSAVILYIGGWILDFIFNLMWRKMKNIILLKKLINIIDCKLVVKI